MFVQVCVFVCLCGVLHRLPGGGVHCVESFVLNAIVHYALPG